MSKAMRALEKIRRTSKVLDIDVPWKKSLKNPSLSHYGPWKKTLDLYGPGTKYLKIHA